MSKRHATALAEERENQNDESRSPGLEQTPSRGPAQTPWRMATVLWGIPLLFFIVAAVLKECVGLTIW